MKMNDVRDMDDEDLRARLAELRAERFNLRFRSATEAVTNPMQFRTIRRDIARLETVLRERALKAAR